MNSSSIGYPSSPQDGIELRSFSSPSSAVSHDASVPVMNQGHEISRWQDFKENVKALANRINDFFSISLGPRKTPDSPSIFSLGGAVILNIKARQSINRTQWSNGQKLAAKVGVEIASRLHTALATIYDTTIGGLKGLAKNVNNAFQLGRIKAFTNVAQIKANDQMTATEKKMEIAKTYLREVGLFFLRFTKALLVDTSVAMVTSFVKGTVFTIAPTWIADAAGAGGSKIGENTLLKRFASAADLPNQLLAKTSVTDLDIANANLEAAEHLETYGDTRDDAERIIHEKLREVEDRGQATLADALQNLSNAESIRNNAIRNSDQKVKSAKRKAINESIKEAIDLKSKQLDAIANAYEQQAKAYRLLGKRAPSANNNARIAQDAAEKIINRKATYAAEMEDLKQQLLAELEQ